MRPDPAALPPLLYLFIIVAIGLEIAWYLAVRRRAYPWRELAVSVAIFAMRVPTKLLQIALVAPIFAFFWTYRSTTVPLDTWWGLALLFLGTEFCYYWFHRCSHEIRWIWASHSVHHSPERIHLASAFRLAVTDLVSGGWIFFLPLIIVGFHPTAVAEMLAINLFYQFWLHTDIVGKLGPLERVLNTPSHHRVHHATNPEYLDRNYGGILIIWDRLFGTFAEERPGIAIAYGLVQPVGSHNPLTIAFHQWIAMIRDVRRARSWRQRFRQLFGRPGDSLSATSSGTVPATSTS
jgi:sterol desaturase/sphingolipid hydroxylase (fatty acid hydroxylase superfamily)